jgi:hypothetical protein
VCGTTFPVLWEAFIPHYQKAITIDLYLCHEFSPDFVWYGIINVSEYKSSGIIKSIYINSKFIKMEKNDLHGKQTLGENSV